MSRQETGEKTEKPTAKRLRDARKRGQVARSQDLINFIMLSAVLAYLWLGWPLIFERIVALFDALAGMAYQGRVADIRDVLSEQAGHAFDETSVILMPILLVAIVAGGLASGLQAKFVISWDAIKPKGERISPAAGLKRVFSFRQVFEGVKTLIKVLVIGLLLTGLFFDLVGSAAKVPLCGMPCLTAFARYGLGRAVFSALAVFMVLAVADWLYQRAAFLKQMRMSRAEVQREYKETEGDPQMKSRRRKLAQEFLMMEGRSAAANATALIMNPTHLAVAIFYQQETAPLPLVTAKARGVEARQMRDDAMAAGVPIFRNVALARMLYAETGIMQPVPDAVFDVIAEILVWIDAHRHALYGDPLDEPVIDLDPPQSAQA